MRNRLLLMTDRSVMDVDPTSLKPFHRVKLKNLACISAPFAHSTAMVIKIDGVRSKISDFYLNCADTNERSALLDALRTGFQATTGRPLATVEWDAAHPRALVACAGDGHPSAGLAFAAPTGRRDSFSSDVSIASSLCGSELSVSAVDVPITTTQSLARHAARAGVFAAVESHEEQEMEEQLSLQKQHEELLAAEEEIMQILVAMRTTGPARGGAGQQELNVTLDEVRGEIRKLEARGANGR